MSDNKITILFALVYFALILGVGFLAGKKASSSGLSGYMIGGQSLGVFVCSLGIMAAVMSGWTWLGNPGTAYAQGYAGIIKICVLCPIGCVLSYITLAKPVRIISQKFGCLTLPDILTTRFQNKQSLRVISTLIILIGSFTYLVSQWTSMGTVVEMVLGCSYHKAVIIGAVIISAYVIAGGMLASMWTNFVQMIIMFVVAGIVVFKSIHLCGGFTEMNHTLAEINPDFIKPFTSGGLGPIAVLSYSVPIIVLCYGGQPAVNTKFMMIKDTKSFRWATLISCIAIIIGVSVIYIGFAGKVMVYNGILPEPEKADQIFLSVINSIFSPGMAALVMVAVMAAVMSTAESHLFNSASTLILDLIVRTFHVGIEEKKVLLYTRIAMAAVTVITVALAMRPPAMISAIGAQAFGTFCAGFGPVVYIGLRWRHMNTKGAVAGLLVGLVFGGILPLIDSAFFSGTLFANVSIAGVGTILSAIAAITVSLLTKPERSPVFH